MTVLELPLSSIVVAERAREHVDVEDLVESIRQVGLLQPIVVRPSGESYELVAGGRRLRAFEVMGEMLIRAEVREATDDEALVLEAVENGVRESFRPSEAAALGMKLEARAKADPEVLGKLPSGERLSERVAKAVGMGDRTYRKARDVLRYEPTTDDGREIAAAIERAMDETGSVDAAHRAVAALQVLEEWAADPVVTHLVEPVLAAQAWDGPGLDLTALAAAPDEIRGRVDGARTTHRIQNEAPGEPGPGVADPTVPPVDEHDATEGGSDVPAQTSEQPAGFACRTCGLMVDPGSDETTELTICPRCDSDTWHRTPYPVGPFELDHDVIMLRMVPALEDGTAALVVCEHCDSAVFVPPATGHDLLLGACPACSKIEWASCSIDRVEVNHGGNVEPYSAPQPREQTRSLAERARARANVASDWQVAPGWPEISETVDHTVLRRHDSAWRGFIAGIIDGRPIGSYASKILKTEQEAVAWLDAELADAPAPAPILDGSESPAPDSVNGVSRTAEGDELVPDPSTPVEGEVSDEECPPLSSDPEDARPARAASDDGESEFRRSDSPSTTHLPKREPQRRPVPTSDFVELAHHLAAAVSIAGQWPAAEVERVLATYDDPDALISRFQSAAQVLPDYLADLRHLAKPPS